MAMAQAGRDLREPRLHVGDHAVGVFARAHDDDSADDLLAIHVEHAAAEIAADTDRSYVA